MTAKSIWARALVATIILAMIVAFMPVISNGGDVHAASKKVKVTFKANGGKIGTKTSKVKNVTKGKKVGKLPKANQKGYTLKGWYTKKSGGKKITKNTKVKKKTTYYAQWTAKEYTVNFDANGGETPSFKSKKVKYKSKYGTLPGTKRTGYNFKGWYTAKSGGNNVTANSINTIATASTLYAQWEKVSEPYYRLLLDSGTIVSSTKPGNFLVSGGAHGSETEPFVVYSYPADTVVTIKADVPEGKNFTRWSVASNSLLFGYRFADGYDETTEITKVLIPSGLMNTSMEFLISAKWSGM